MVTENKLVTNYDRKMTSKWNRLYYGASDYCNFGYWTPETKNARDASMQLTNKLIEMMPNKTGKVLDVACGLGATTREVSAVFGAENVTAINISAFQLRRAEQNAPGATFKLMNATQLDFPDASFDNIICVEAAFHFHTRDAFLREAARVLKPGGMLVMSDMVFKKQAHWSAIPKANFVRNMQDYHSHLVRCGFTPDSQVIDATKECWELFGKHQMSWFGQMRKERMISGAEAFFARIGVRLWRWSMGTMKNYILVAAHKAP